MRRNFLVIAVAVLVLVPTAFLLFRTVFGGANIATTLSVPYTTMAHYSSHTMLASDGRKLLAYNYQTNVTTPVSPDTGVGGLAIDSLSVTSDQRSILFHVNFPAEGTSLYKILQAGGQDPTLDSWWLFSTKTQTYRPLPTGTLVAKLDDSRVYGLTITTNGESVVSYSLDDLKQISTVSVIPSTDFAVAGNGYILENTDNNVYFTTDGIVNRQLATRATIVATTDSGKQAIISDSGHKLLQIDLEKLTTKTLAKDVAGQPLWQSSGLILYNTSASTPHYYVYDLHTHKSASWKFARGIYPDGNPISLLDATTAAISNTSNNTVLVGKNLYNPTGK